MVQIFSTSRPRVQMHLMKTAWLSNEVRQAMLLEAEAQYPRETGGVLMGYWTTHGVVITDVIGPGPHAIHGRSFFSPDYGFQEQEIARIYKSKGRIVTYLGDWHSHPDGPEFLSKLDLATLNRIASCREARAASPVMLLVCGNPDDWRCHVWNLTARRVFFAKERVTSRFDLAPRPTYVRGRLNIRPCRFPAEVVRIEPNGKPSEARNDEFRARPVIGGALHA
ncbi:MAG: Mov34/MPN/PAD-1 family protein [Verrucomicrobiota bacterium]